MSDPGTAEARAWLRQFDGKAVAQLVLLIGLVGLFWSTPVVYPLRLLVVFFHELSHGLAAIATGGSVVRIEIVAGVGGVCVTRGGSHFLTLTAGYLGSLVWGGLLLLVAARTRADRGVLALLGMLLVAVSVIYVRPLVSFGFGFGIAAGVACLASSAYLRNEVNDFLLRVIGLTSCLYAPLDIKSDILDRPELLSDAAMLGELTGLPTLFWGLLWSIIAVYTSARFLVAAGRKTTAGPDSVGAGRFKV